jgi:hypothetical protein
MSVRRAIQHGLVCAALLLGMTGLASAQRGAGPQGQNSIDDLALFRRPPPDLIERATTPRQTENQPRRAARPRRAETRGRRAAPPRRQEAPQRPAQPPAAPAAQAAPTAPAAAAPPQNAPTVIARFGSHGGFERMMLAWPNAPTPEIRQDGDRIEITLTGAPQLDEAAIIRGLVRVGSEVSVGREGDAVIIRITANPGIGVRAERSADRIWFDFGREPPASQTAGSTSAPSAQPQTAQAPAAASAPRQPPPPRGNERAQTAQPSPPPAAQRAPERPATPAQPAPAAQQAAQQAASPAPAQAAPTPSQQARDQTVRVEATRSPEGVVLRFHWDEPVAAAVFARGSTLWLVFDSRRALDLAPLRALADDLGEVDAAIGEVTALRMAPSFGAAAAARREGDAWVIELLRRARPPVSSIELALRRGDANRPRLWAAVPGAQRVVRLNDPEIGDSFLVAPTAAGGHGVDVARGFVQFRLPATAQGLVIEPRSDDVQVRALGGGVDIATARGMIAAAPAEPAQAAPEPRRSTLFDLDAWRGGGPARFMEERMALQRAVTAAREEGRGEARLALAQFLFAHGFAVDALGVMRLLEQEHPTLLDAPRARAMRGAAALLAGDLDLARRNLAHASLADHPEAILWRAMLALEEGSAQRAIVDLAQTRDISDRYPAPFANRLGLAVAEIRLAAEMIDPAEDRLAQVQANQPTPPERARAEYLRGQIQLARGQRDRALATWARVEQGPMTPARVLATLARVEAQLEDRTIEPRAAADALERLRFAWRGDVLEFRVQVRLARLLEGTGDVRRALAAWRDALAVTPDHPDTAAARREAGDAFARYMLEGGFDRAGPIAALAAFEEARPLLPADERRPRMIIRAADRMIGLDLPDRAAAILDRELREQPAAEDRAKFGARLALARLLDRKPAAALDALALSSTAAMAPEIGRERQLLEARALGDLDQTAPALALIADDSSEEADRLRADLQLRLRDWSGLAATLGRLAGPPRDGALSDDQARTVLHLSVAAVLGEDAAGLRALRERYTPAMRASRYADLYEVLTSERGAPPEDMRAVAARVATVAPFRSFLAQYRERLTPARPRS